MDDPSDDEESSQHEFSDYTLPVDQDMVAFFGPFYLLLTILMSSRSFYLSSLVVRNEKRKWTIIAFVCFMLFLP